MFGFLIGTLCLIGLIKVVRGGMGGGCGSRGGFGGRGWGGWSGHQGGWGHHHGGWGREGFSGGPFWMRGLFERLDTSPGQEKVIREAAEELRASGAGLREELKKTREDIAKAVRSPGFDETILGELFARHDTVLEKMRKDAVGAIGKVHAVLEDRQRERLADLIGAGPFGRGGGGPYRTWV